MTASSRPIRAGKRAVSALAASAIAVPISFGMMGATAFAATPPAEQTIVNFCKNVPSSYDAFTDDNGSNAEAAINCLAYGGVVQGGPAGMPATDYGPGLTVTRAQMASFIARMLDTAKNLDTGNNVHALPSASSSPDAFNDDNGNVHESNINRLAAAGIVKGETATQYAPLQPVRRDQMASFIARAANFAATGSVPSSGAGIFATSNDYFTDDNGDVHEANINGIAAQGIAIGTGGGLYQPSASVIRAQMALFIARTLASAMDAGLIGPMAQNSATGGVTLSSTSVAQGGTLTGTVQGTAASVSGCGLTNQSLTDTDTSASGVQFSVTIPQSQAAGSCDLTFSFTDAGGNAKTVTRTITVTQAASNQSYTVTPSTTPDREHGHDLRQNVQYTRQRPAAPRRSTSRCSPAERATTSGTTTFKDSTNPGGTGNVAVQGTVAEHDNITAVNGPPSDGGTTVNGVTPTSGSVTFTVTSEHRG